MASYLFLWNPAIDPGSFTSYEKLVQTTSPKLPYKTPWICPSKQPKPGDQAYIKRTGRKNNGLFAKGLVIAGPYARKSDGRQCVKLSLESMLPLGNEIAGTVLQTPPLDSTFWNSQASGIRIKPESAQELERLRQSLVCSPDPVAAVMDSMIGEETIGPGTFPEGAVRQISVNVFERNADARRICLEHHGMRCSVCKMTFAERYGSIANDFIHVHHLRQLALVGKDYQVDPIADLRPVCPNCHAMIHLRTPPYSIDDIREMLTAAAIEAAKAKPA